MRKLLQATKKPPTPPFLKIDYTGSAPVRHLLFDFMLTWGENYFKSKELTNSFRVLFFTVNRSTTLH